MSAKPILLLGDEILYRISEEIQKSNLDKAKQVINDLHDTIVSFKNQYGFGRAIAAPQIGESVRIIYMHLGNKTHYFINPVLEFIGEDTFQLWDDCMSFPGLEVYVERHRKCKVNYKNLNWEDCEMYLEGDLSELFQHEYDHLDGIFAVQRAKDLKSFRINKNKSGY
ncbi:peptide deformylase [Clostridium botulinum]